MSRQSIVDHIPGLRRYARALTADAWAADDLVQDTLERACGKWRLWLVGSDLRAWLFTLMHNIYANQVRGAVRRARHATLVELEAHAAELVAPRDAADLELDLQRCLMRLPEDQRAVLLLVTLEDMAYADVARVLGVPIGTVMSRLSRARSRLRELMEGGAAPARDPASGLGEQDPAVPVLRLMKQAGTMP
jgi:RNA polymerase sigma-70 factor (ECF subfamily)